MGGTPKNIHTSIEWYLKSAYQGFAVAQYNLANVYENEEKVKDIPKALEWYKKASKQDHKEATKAFERLSNKGPDESQIEVAHFFPSQVINTDQVVTVYTGGEEKKIENEKLTDKIESLDNGIEQTKGKVTKLKASGTERMIKITPKPSISRASRKKRSGDSNVVSDNNDNQCDLNCDSPDEKEEQAKKLQQNDLEHSDEYQNDLNYDTQSDDDEK